MINRVAFEDFVDRLHTRKRAGDAFAIRARASRRAAPDAAVADRHSFDGGRIVLQEIPEHAVYDHLSS